MTSDTTTKGVGVQSDAPIAVNVPRPVTTIPHRFRDLLALDDFERHAKRHLPTMVFHHVCGGVETETALRGTRDAYRKYRFVPRMFVDVSGRKQDTTLFGHTFSHPFGVGPLGGGVCSLSRRPGTHGCGQSDECAYDSQRLVADFTGGRHCS